MIKRLLSSVLLAALCIPAFQQSAKVLNYQIVDMKQFHFGFTIGLNSFDFNFNRKYSQDTLVQIIHLTPGFNELRLNEDFALRFTPGLVFGQRNVSLLNHNSRDSAFSNASAESNYIDLPFLLKYKAKRLYNFRPYLLTGISLRYDMAGRKSQPFSDRLDIMKMKPFDIYIEIGYGMDFYLTYFKLSTEIKLSLGTQNIMDPLMNFDHYGLTGFTSQIILINFHFE
jgi:hypothetical protein